MTVPPKDTRHDQFKNWNPALMERCIRNIGFLDTEL